MTENVNTEETVVETPEATEPEAVETTETETAEVEEGTPGVLPQLADALLASKMVGSQKYADLFASIVLSEIVAILNAYGDEAGEVTSTSDVAALLAG